jgi:hypothetical protein
MYLSTWLSLGLGSSRWYNPAVAKPSQDDDNDDDDDDDDEGVCVLERTSLARSLAICAGNDHAREVKRDWLGEFLGWAREKQKVEMQQ